MACLSINYMYLISRETVSNSWNFCNFCSRLRCQLVVLSSFKLLRPACAQKDKASASPMVPSPSAMSPGTVSFAASDVEVTVQAEVIWTQQEIHRNATGDDKSWWIRSLLKRDIIIFHSAITFLYFLGYISERAEADSRAEPKKLKHKLNKRSLGMRINWLSSYKTLELIKDLKF